MGLFRAKGICSICGSENGKQIKDGFICSKCINDAWRYLSQKRLTNKQYTVSLIQECITKSRNYKSIQDERESIFEVTKQFSTDLFIDEKNKLFRLKKGLLDFNDIYSFDQIVDYEVIENGTSVVKGGLGKAIVGGALFGSAGAIVGGVIGNKKTKNICNSLQIRIGLDDSPKENIYIKLINSETKTKSFSYKINIEIANDIITFFSKITNSLENQDNGTIANNTDPYTELKKLKELLDMKIITADEFETKKKELLNL